MKQLLRTGLIAIASLSIGALAGAQPVINEVLYDGPGTDAGMFTELKGEPGLNLDGYVLVGVNGNGGVVYAMIPLTGSIPADGYFVVAQDGSVAEADLIDALADWQNGADQVKLIYAPDDSVLIDSVCYGFSDALVCEGGTNAPDVPAGTSIVRCPDGNDTDDNAADFFPDDSPTPGAENDPPECAIQPPLDVDLCQVMENDAEGFPVLYGQRVRVTDIVATVATGVFRLPGSGLEITVYQPSTGCCTILFDFNYDDLAQPIDEGDLITEFVGTVDFYNGATELTGVEVLTVSGTAALPDPIEITAGELAVNGEQYESCLIKICGLSVLDTGDPWPPDGSNANVDIDDGTGPTIMRVDKETDIDGSPQPEEPFTATGLGSQFDDAAPWDSGYQIKPRRRSEIEDGVDCGGTPVYEKSWSEIKGMYKN